MLQTEYGKAAGAIDAARKIDRAGGLLKEAARDMAKANQQGGQRPGPPPPGNGGAGVVPRRP